MHCFDIEATPKPGTEMAEEYEGALVNCYVNFPLKDGAELLARYYIECEGDWVAGEKRGEAWMEEEDFADRPDRLECFHIALKAGVHVNFHAFPRRADADELVN